jgi:uncharacterized Zn ribbon protein
VFVESIQIMDEFENINSMIDNNFGEFTHISEFIRKA